MKIIRGVLPALALTAACAMPPEGTDEQDSANYDAAVASVGCDLRTESEYLAVELQTGLTRAQLQEMSDYKVANGAAQRFENGGVRLVTGTCAPTVAEGDTSAPGEA
ncbi:NADH dehydrogenase [Roseivivax halodurans JCM 10272]|uniref:NADH dehydrogenase n=1 Tax=Roseivivax halodurans JCM 10272 TaxID=1449350 RepID=X7EF18_9RHOB|nr:hypothetical protein [Roseivivax halodurans]ETX14522.1 NADH dehydrogenase [Roseivivax halodurans JCM 10272]